MAAPGPVWALAGLSVRGLRVRPVRAGRLTLLMLRACFVVAVTTMILLGVAPPR